MLPAYGSLKVTSNVRCLVQLQAQVIAPAWVIEMVALTSPTMESSARHFTPAGMEVKFAVARVTAVADAPSQTPVIVILLLPTAGV